ncbi:hypothetical protein [uncultured Mobiluncus sp.]|uniref:hypothetical protein n=1 Tax=uncultured Mobiluncus sp. TaxID=293425 RepID=UPI0026163D41|nr:hypothetical protein [uncultured Mobiluncus sp.]
MENHKIEMSGLEALRSLDPAQNLPVDLDSLRAKVAAQMESEGLAFETQPPAHVVAVETADTQAPVAEVVSLAVRRHTLAVRRNWLVGLSAAAAATVVGFTGWSVLSPGEPGELPNQGDGVVIADGPIITAAGSEIMVPGASQRLEKVGDVEFVAAGNFSTAPTKAPILRLDKGANVSADQVQKVANSLGMRGSVKRNSSGFTVTDTKGAILTVTVGQLTSLSFDNPSAVRMECVPVKPGDGTVELPNPDATQNPTGNPSSNSGQSPAPNTPTTPSTTPSEPSDPTEPTSTPTPKWTPTPTQTPTETVPPAVRPDSPEQSHSNPTGATHNVDTSNTTDLPGTVVEIGQLQLLLIVTETTDPSESSPTESVQPQATQNPSPDPTPCVMKVAGNAPSSEKAIAQVEKVAASLGATVMSRAAGTTQKDGLTTVSVPVKMPGQTQAQNWKAVVSETGVASIRANLGKETKIGEYKVISEAQAVQRLNDPKYGPLDVRNQKGLPAKIDGRIDLVSARLISQPVKQKDGSILDMPVYLLTDSQGRVWTVSAVAE